MQVYEKTSLIRCNVEELFEFHLQSKNIKYITPPDTKVVLQNEDFEAKEGEILKIKSIKYFIPVKWEVQISKLKRPNLLVDTALKSPFAFWEHTHSFKQLGEFCELKDVVKFKMPFGFLGAMLNFFMMRELKNMFEFRHIATGKRLEKKERA